MERAAHLTSTKTLLSLLSLSSDSRVDTGGRGGEGGEGRGAECMQKHRNRMAKFLLQLSNEE